MQSFIYFFDAKLCDPSSPRAPGRPAQRRRARAVCATQTTERPSSRGSTLASACPSTSELSLSLTSRRHCRLARQVRALHRDRFHLRHRPKGRSTSSGATGAALAATKLPPPVGPTPAATRARTNRTSRQLAGSPAHLTGRFWRCAADRQRIETTASGKLSVREARAAG